jgi:hypothetical protein
MKRPLVAVLLTCLVPASISVVACKNRSGRDVTTPSSLTTPTTPASGPPELSNSEPLLAIKIHPRRGPAPLEVGVNMCQTSDPDADPLTFEYKWGGTSHRKVTTSCREDHTYAARGTYKALFCVDDGHDHPVCRYELIVVG